MVSIENKLIRFILPFTNQQLTAFIQPIIRDKINIQPNIMCRCHGNIAQKPDIYNYTAQHSHLFNSKVQLICPVTGKQINNVNHNVYYKFMQYNQDNKFNKPYIKQNNIHENQLDINNIDTLYFDHFTTYHILSECNSIYGKVC